MATKKDPDQQLQEIRNRIADLKDERSGLKGYVRTREEALAALDQWIERQRFEFEKDASVNGLIKGNPEVRLHVTGWGNGERSWTEAMAALFPEAIREHFAARIDRELEGRETMSRAARDQREHEIAAELLQAEQEEEDLVSQLQANGHKLQRRGDADPKAVLGLTEAPPMPQRPEPEEADAS